MSVNRRRTRDDLLRVALAVALTLGGVTSTVRGQVEIPNPMYDANQPDRFGAAVALGEASTGDLLAFISAPGSNAVHQFTDSGSGWIWMGPFMGPSNANESFGSDLVLRSANPSWNNGWALAIACPRQGSSSGAVLIAASTGSSQFFDLNFASQPFDFFGAEVAFAGDRLVVSAPGDATWGSSAGALYVYSPTYSSGVLSFPAPALIDSSAAAAAGTGLGGLLAVSEDWIFAANSTGAFSGDVWIFHRVGNTFVSYAAQPNLGLSVSLSHLSLEGEVLTVCNSATGPPFYLGDFKWSPATGRWEPIRESTSGLPQLWSTEGALGIGHGPAGSGWTICTNLEIRSFVRSENLWQSTGYSLPNNAVGGGDIAIENRRLLVGSIAGRDCSIPSSAWGTAWFYDFQSDRDVNGIPDADEIQADPCLDLDNNGVLDSLEGVRTVWLGTGDGNFLEDFDLGRNEWNWSDGPPPGKRVAMSWAESAPGTVTLDDSGQTHSVFGLEVAGNAQQGQTLTLRIASNSHLDVASPTACASLLINDRGHIFIDDGLLTASRARIVAGGLLEIDGSPSSEADLTHLEPLPPGARVELGGGTLTSSSLTIGMEGGNAESGGQVSGFGEIDVSGTVAIKKSGVIQIDADGAAETLDVGSATFTSAGSIVVGADDDLDISSATMDFEADARTVVAAKGELNVALTGFLPVAHSGDLELLGDTTGSGSVDVSQSSTPMLSNTSDGLIHGWGTIVGDVINAGRIEVTEKDAVISMDVVSNLQRGELLSTDEGKLSMKRLINQGGDVQVMADAILETTSGEVDNTGTIWVDRSLVSVAGETKNRFGFPDAGLICLKDLTGVNSWSSGGAFSNEIGARLEVADSIVNAAIFDNVGEAIFSGSSFVNAPGALTNQGEMCATSGTLIMSGTSWTNTGTVCIDTGATVIAAGSLLLPGGGVSWNCSCSLTPSCIDPPISLGADPAELLVVGDLVADSLASLSLNEGRLELLGDFDVAIRDPQKRTLNRGTLVMSGSSQELELLSRDRGASAPFGAQAKGQIGMLQIGPAPTSVRLVDRHDNDGGNEVLYVKELQLDAGTTLDLAGRTLYYESLQQHPSSTVTDSVGGGQLMQNQPPFQGSPTVSPRKAGGKK